MQEDPTTAPFVYCGDEMCIACDKYPAKKMWPCGHFACKEHSTYDGEKHCVCGYCGQRAIFVGSIKSPDPFITPGRPTTAFKIKRPAAFAPDLQSLSVAISAERGIQQTIMRPEQGGDFNPNAEDNKPGAPWRNSTAPWYKSTTWQRNKDVITPTPEPGQSRRNTTTQAGRENEPPQRYIPPPMRGALGGLGGDPGNDRPRSSVSNSSFASQPQPQLQQSAYHPTGYGFTLPHGRYRWGPAATPYAPIDPFASSGPPPSSSSTNLTARPSHGNYIGLGSNLNPSAALQSAFSNTTPSSHNDSAAANAAGANVSDAVQLANLIRAGRADDPSDPDYGNPGRSRRLPEEPPQGIPTAPMPRGKVASTDSPAYASFLQLEENIKGNAAAFLGTNDIQPPSWFFQLGRGYHPSVEEVVNMLPMIDACAIAKPTTAGIIKVMNIPYNTSRSELVSFLGRNARIVSQPEGSPFHAVHIIMDRHSAKTMDAFVELTSVKEANYIVNSFQRRIQERRHVKIGDRDVTVKVVTQGDLMAELFPRAKNVEWAGSVPHISTKVNYYYKGVPSTGFIGFFQNEEIVFMNKHVENSSRSPFAQRVPIRAYEHLITLLHKYPWHAHEHVLLSERQAFHDMTVRYIRMLMERLREDEVRNGPPPKGLQVPTTTTLKELAVAALTCPGFSESQKAAIVLQLRDGNFKYLIDGRGFNLRFGGDHMFATEWPFHALIMQPGVSNNVVEFIASVFRAATPGMEQLSIADLNTMSRHGPAPPRFGMLNLNHQNIKTLADLARMEFRAIEVALSAVLRRDNPNQSLVLSRRS